MSTPGAQLLRRVCKVTLFTRERCLLCDSAKGVLSNVWEKRPFEYSEIDVMSPGQERWKDAYEFDTPVIHVEMRPAKNDEQRAETTPWKAMHRFNKEQVEDLIDKAGKDTSL